MHILLKMVSENLFSGKTYFYTIASRAIGVSNFTVAHLRELKKTARVMPMVNQGWVF